MKKRERSSTSALQQFVYPLGIRLYEGENYRQRELYEVRYLKDDEIPRYHFQAALSLRRAGALFHRLFDLLGRRVSAVIEIPEAAEEEPAKPGAAAAAPAPCDRCEVWMSPDLDAEVVRRAFVEHEHLMLHDGCIGFGALSAETDAALIIDDHKILNYYTRDLEAASRLFREGGLQAVDRLRHFADLSHVHYSLAELGLGEDYEEVFQELRERLHLELEDTREYT